ncbi:MAG: S8 family serine peptidase [Oligoflexia bacterium]|nr:S8 family serine peptidase [Oligoflexia bacterium]
MKITISILLFTLFQYVIHASVKSQWVYKKKENKKIDKVWNLVRDQRISTPVIAVIDTGIDFNHKDLSNNLWINRKERDGKPGVDDDGNGYVDDIYGWNFINNSPDVRDDHSHGTHVSGIIAAGRNNYGVTGINPYARIMTLKAFKSDGKGVSRAVAKSIIYAVKNGAKIINCSFVEFKYNQYLANAVNYALRRNVVIVGAAGNNGKNINDMDIYLGNFEGPIIVGAHTSTFRVWNKSNIGDEKVHLYSPGTKIISTTPKDRYRAKSGTSMATPYVAGALSLLISLGEKLDQNLAMSFIEQSIEHNERYSDSILQGRMNIFKLLDGYL